MFFQTLKKQNSITDLNKVNSNTCTGMRIAIYFCTKKIFQQIILKTFYSLSK